MNALIIGGGLGGLFLGAILAKEGLKVTILEKNSTVGGGLQSFKRQGEWFDTGMHVVGGLRPGGNIRRLCDYLGIADKITVADVDDDCCDEMHFGEDGRSYWVATGREGFIQSLTEQFPAERDGISRYVDAIFNIADGIDLFNLRPFQGFGMGINEDGLVSADAFIASFVKDRKLRSVLAYMNPLYGGRANQTPAYIHAIIQVLYIRGASRFVGGSYRFAETLADMIRSNGGEIVTGDAVKRIAVENRKVTKVVTSQGHEYQADWYISAIHPCAMLDIIDEGAFPRSFRNRLNDIPNSYSAFSLYIKFKPDSFPYINHSVYYLTQYDKVWEFDDPAYDSQWPMGFLFMTPPEDNQGPYATKALITAPMRFDHVQRWADTTLGRRPDDYKEWKERMCQLLIERIETIYPEIRDKIEYVNTASPLTIRDYYGSKEGCISGFSKDHNNMALSQLPVVTKVRNLLLTGQCNNLHGFCGTPLTAINTAEAILGLNSIVNKINQQS